MRIPSVAALGLLLISGAAFANDDDKSRLCDVLIPEVKFTAQALPEVAAELEKKLAENWPDDGTRPPSVQFFHPEPPRDHRSFAPPVGHPDDFFGVPLPAVEPDVKITINLRRVSACDLFDFLGEMTRLRWDVVGESVVFMRRRPDPGPDQLSRNYPVLPALRKLTADPSFTAEDLVEWGAPIQGWVGYDPKSEVLTVHDTRSNLMRFERWYIEQQNQQPPHLGKRRLDLLLESGDRVFGEPLQEGLTFDVAGAPVAVSFDRIHSLWSAGSASNVIVLLRNQDQLRVPLTTPVVRLRGGLGTLEVPAESIVRLRLDTWPQRGEAPIAPIESRHAPSRNTDPFAAPPAPLIDRIFEDEPLPQP